MALRDLFSFLRPKEAERRSSTTTTNRFEIRDNKLTITHNGASRTFDLAAGINDALAGELARMGLSASDLRNLIHLSQQPPSRSKTLLRINDQRSVRTIAGSPQELAKQLSAAGLASADKLNQLLNSPQSTHISRLTITVNGQQHTYDTTSGISAELKEQLAKQMGISVSELATMLKLPGHSSSAAPSATDCSELPGEDDPQASTR